MIDDVISREGGFVNHPDDRGGATNYGITQATLSAWLGRRARLAEVQNLDIDTARAIYARRYLSAPRIDTLTQRIVPFVFDTAVLHGPRSAIRLLQRVLNRAGFGKVCVDGVIGPQTRKACEAADRVMGPYLLDALCEQRRAIYHRIVARNPSQKVFLRGWLNRLKHFKDETS
ncbi:MAG: glycosyl hydrolase 108 family protein [Pseudomonadota bacterium]